MTSSLRRSHACWRPRFLLVVALVFAAWSWSQLSVGAAEGRERTLTANGIEIWTEAFGDSDSPATLLIMGASAQGIRWPNELIDGLVAAGRHVIRYDNRDTGQSTSFDFAAHPYTLDDLALDAVGVLDGYGIDVADVVGASMGGMIVQRLIVNHRDRVRTVTMIMSSPLSGGGDVPELSADDLPGPREEFMAELLANTVPAETRDGRIEQRIKLFEMLTGSAEPYDSAVQREIATLEVDRARDFPAMNNHPLAIARSTPADRRPQLRSVNVRALVVHGTEDPLLLYEHGVALAETIPGAELLTLEGAGHELPQMYLSELVARIVALGDE